MIVFPLSRVITKSLSVTGFPTVAVIVICPPSFTSLPVNVIVEAGTLGSTGILGSTGVVGVVVPTGFKSSVGICS